MIKTVKVGNTDITLKASAATPRLYRSLFNKDIFVDYAKLINNDGNFGAEQLEIFERLAYTMAKQADDTIPNSDIEWLDSIDGVLSIYNVFPDLLALWNGNLESHSESKKKADKQ
jgi:hypothetical protein